MLLRTAEGLGIRVQSLQHVLEGYKIAPEIAKHGASCSTFADWWAYKVEAFDAIPANAALLHEAGANTVIKSDDWELIRHLYHEASKTLRYGNMPPDAALQAITRNPARELGLADRMGTIEPGKDADFAMYSRHPFDVLTRCDYTFIDGELYFSRADAPRVDGQQSGVEGFALRVEGQNGNEAAGAPASPSTPLAGSQSPPPTLNAKPSTSSPPATTSSPSTINHQPSTSPWTPPDAAARRPLLDAAPSPSGKYAYVGATLHPIDAPDIERGTLLVVDGKIAGLGGTVEIPTDAKTIDASGLHIYPGLIDAGTTLGLLEIGKVGETHDFAETGAMQQHHPFPPQGHGGHHERPPDIQGVTAHGKKFGCTMPLHVSPILYDVHVRA